jgi:hypothetical protein
MAGDRIGSYLADMFSEFENKEMTVKAIGKLYLLKKLSFSQAKIRLIDEAHLSNVDAIGFLKNL